MKHKKSIRYVGEPKIFMLWDESHLWGLMLLRALRFWEMPLRVISADMISRGILEEDPPDILMVPGGWARLKSRALGSSGRSGIKKYIREGGTYMGFCGGAGLGLSSSDRDDFLDLCPCTRKPMHNRLPNFSGYLRCRVNLENGREEKTVLPVWWPSQFSLGENPEINILSRYLHPDHDFWVADLKAGDIPQEEFEKWEAAYKINLDPARLKEEPCILQGSYGKGEFILSYAHLETPGAKQANTLFLRLLENRGIGPPHREKTIPQWDIFSVQPTWDAPGLTRAHQELCELVRTGGEHFLINQRAPWLLGWRRGIPGSALNFLLAMLARALKTPPSKETKTHWEEQEKDFLSTWEKFISGMQDYLLRERLVLAERPSSPEASGDKELQAEKERLTGKFPGYGGLYGKLLGRLDGLVWRLVREEK